MDSASELQAEASMYWMPGYDTIERLISYCYQINNLMADKTQTILEIGCGSGFVRNYLKDHGFNITFVDVDEQLHPDIVASVTSIPLPDESFDIVNCCEVLEHLPWESFDKALREIYRLCRKGAILSLPDASGFARLGLKLPKLPGIHILISSPVKRKFHFDGQHYWEIGRAGYPLAAVISTIRDTGFKIVRTYRVFENPYHRFIVLNKNA